MLLSESTGVANSCREHQELLEDCIRGDVNWDYSSSAICRGQCGLSGMAWIAWMGIRWEAYYTHTDTDANRRCLAGRPG